MCSFKRYKQHEKITPWLTPEIYRMMRERDRLIRLFRHTPHNNLWIEARRNRNRVNSLMYRAKSDYIKLQLNNNSNNPNKFWRVIKNLIDITTTVLFYDYESQDYVVRGSEANYLNNYFINIVRNLNIPPNDESMLHVYNVDSSFCFIDDLPTTLTIVKIVKRT